MHCEISVLQVKSVLRVHCTAILVHCEISVQRVKCTAILVPCPNPQHNHAGAGGGPALLTPNITMRGGGPALTLNMTLRGGGAALTFNITMRLAWGCTRGSFCTALRTASLSSLRPVHICTLITKSQIRVARLTDLFSIDRRCGHAPQILRSMSSYMAISDAHVHL